MTWLKRIGLFVMTNVLVMVTVGLVWSLVSHFLQLNGINSYIPLLMALSLVMGMTGSFISLLISKWMAKKMYGVQIIDPQTHDPELRRLLERVHSFARRSQLVKMPEVGIYESPDINAFATGPSKKNSMVAVSTGLMRQLNESEVDGVLAHEVSHIANGDMVTMTLIQGIVNAFAFFFSRILANIISSNVDEKLQGIVHFACVIIGDILFTFLGSFVVASFSRAREFRADAGGAKLASRDSMIGALRKLKLVMDRDPSDDPQASDALASMKISSRKHGGGIWALLMTHPPLDVRIQALQSGTYANSGAKLS